MCWYLVNTAREGGRFFVNLRISCLLFFIQQPLQNVTLKRLLSGNENSLEFMHPFAFRPTLENILSLLFIF